MSPELLHTCSLLRSHCAFYHALGPSSAHQNTTLPVGIDDVHNTAILMEASGSPVRMSFGHSCSTALQKHASKKTDAQTIDVDAMLRLVQELAGLSSASNCARAAWARARLQRMTWGACEAVTRCLAPQPLTQDTLNSSNAITFLYAVT